MSSPKSPTDGAPKPNEPIKLRPHHGLCTAFFIGKGYSEGFAENMRSVMDMLNKDGAEVLLTEGADAICAKCPKNIDGVCGDNEKSSRYDKAVTEICGHDFGDVLRWKYFSSLCTEKIINARRLSSVCGDCRWYDICGR